MDATALLATLAQLGVALAGFSGIVVVLGHRARGAWSVRERVLLSTLLGASGSAVLWSLVPQILLAAAQPARAVWLLSSGGWLVTQLIVLFVRSWQIARNPEARERERRFLWLGYAGGLAALALQSANLLWLATAWPHLTAVSWHLALSFLVFVRLLRTEEAQ